MAASPAGQQPAHPPSRAPKILTPAAVDAALSLTPLLRPLARLHPSKTTTTYRERASVARASHPAHVEAFLVALRCRCIKNRNSNVVRGIFRGSGRPRSTTSCAAATCERGPSSLPGRVSPASVTRRRCISAYILIDKHLTLGIFLSLFFLPPPPSPGPMSSNFTTFREDAEGNGGDNNVTRESSVGHATTLPFCSF